MLAWTSSKASRTLVRPTNIAVSPQAWLAFLTLQPSNLQHPSSESGPINRERTTSWSLRTAPRLPFTPPRRRCPQTCSIRMGHQLVNTTLSAGLVLTVNELRRLVSFGSAHITFRVVWLVTRQCRKRDHLQDVGPGVAADGVKVQLQGAVSLESIS